ncbi:alpha/beta fold hydrolase [Actinomadura rupiterrae]|uniref:alpha/beta fold hydrolase n=1 Tax=Actinomadura rupiterrae TaxID=559627 RepID=UPI0020A473C3|nr:alpha/beta hydrolase [Actinomadura rupiterrae]MCP2337803.1 pimeloyl-ACP methyl ester carboxylesterase [Actinomadura rupiterrae]
METVTSADGTVIAYDKVGDGPALIVSVGAFCDRKTFVAPPELSQRFTVITYDRRGRGDSGDTQPFAPEREYEDLAAVAAASSSEAPFVFGHSSGAAIALRAAAAGMSVAGLVAYEAPFATADTPQPDVDPAEHIRMLVASDRRGEAVSFWMSDVTGLPEEVLAQMDGAPWVKALEPVAHTLPYDLAVTGGGVPADELGKITAPVLVLVGEDSPAWFQDSVASQAAATPGAQLSTLKGFGHNAPPEVITPLLIDFFTPR